MPNLYGKPTFLASDVKTGTVVINNPTHATISANKMSGFVGETITLSASVDTNYIISYYTVNGSKITSNKFILVEGVNTVSAVVQYVEPTVQEKYTLYCYYYKDDVLDSSLTKTNQFAKGRVISPDNYRLEIDGYDFIEQSIQNSFPIYANSSINYYYEKQEEIDPFDYVSVSESNNVSGGMTNGYLRISINSNAPFDELTLTSSDGEVYYTATQKSSISYSGTISKNSSGRTNEWSFNGEQEYWGITLKTTFRGKAYSRRYENGTIPQPKNVEIKIITYLDGVKSFTYTKEYEEGELVDISSLTDKFKPQTLSQFKSSSPVRDFNAYEGATLELWYESIESTTVYTLTVKHFKGSTSNLYATRTYTIEEGTRVYPTSYDISISGWHAVSYQPSSDFLMNSDKTIQIMYEEDEEPEPTVKLGKPSATFKATGNGYCVYTVRNPNSVTVTLYNGSANMGTIGANSSKDFNFNGTNGSTNTATIHFEASGYLDSDTYSFNYVPSSGGTGTAKAEITASLSGSATSLNGYTFRVVVKNNTSSSITVNSIDSGCGITISGLPATISANSSKTFSGNSKFIFDTGTGFTCSVSTSVGTFTDDYS